MRDFQVQYIHTLAANMFIPNPAELQNSNNFYFFNSRSCCFLYFHYD